MSPKKRAPKSMTASAKKSTQPAKQAGAPTKQVKSPVSAPRKQSAQAPPPSKVRAEARARAKAAADEPPAGRDWWTIGVGAGVSLVAFILYWLTAARDVIAGDTPDFLLAAKTLGVAHAPGYPLVDILGYLFGWLPVGSTPFRIGLLAVVCSTATVALVYATVWRLTFMRAPATAAGLALAFTPLFWRWSLQAETFPLNNLLVALVIYLLVRWHQEPTRRYFLLGAAFVFGLGLTNQQTIVLLVPAILYVVLINRRQFERQPALIGWAALAIVVGIIPYIYVPLASLDHSPANWDYVHSLSAFVRLIKREDYGGLTPSGGGGGANILIRTEYLVRSLGAVVAVSALIGIFYAYQKIRWFFWFSLLAFGFTAFGFLITTNLDPRVPTALFVMERFFLLPLVVIAPLTGLGVAWVGQRLSRWQPSISVRQATTAVAAFAVAASVVVVALNYSTLDVSNDHVAGNYARDVLTGLKPHTILFATGDEADITALYMSTAGGVRPDVTVLVSPIIAAPWYAQSLRHNHSINVPAHMTTLNIIRANPDRPVAFIGDPPDKSIDGKYYLAPDGLVYDLVPESTNISVTQDEATNEAQLARVHVPTLNEIKPVSFESVILAHYANIAYNIGQAFAQAKQNSQAIYWYRRALAIDPSNHTPTKAIEKLSGTS